MRSPNPYIILLMQQAFKKQGFVVVFLLLFNLVTLLGRDSTFIDAAFFTFWGYGCGYANVLEFLGFLIFALAPIYFFSGNLTQHSISQENFVVIRLRKKRNWLLIIQISFVIAVLLYFFSYFLTLSISSILLGRFTLEAEKVTAWSGGGGRSLGEYLTGLLENRTAGQKRRGVTLRQVYHQWYKDGTLPELPRIILEKDRIQVQLE